MPPDKKKPATVAPSKNVFEEIVFLLAGLFLLAVILNQIMNYLSSLGIDNSVSGWAKFLEAFSPFWSVWKVVAVVLSAVSIVWTIYDKKKLGEINKEEEKIYGMPPEESLLKELVEETVKEKKNEKWQRVLEHANSENLSDWRLAIIEADVMLDELLHTLGYHGDSIGEMLRAVDKSDFLSLEAAWEAHKIRNNIAHAGSDFELNERETRRVISLFETVFQEFKII